MTVDGKRIAIIGLGRVGLALASLFQSAGHQLVALKGRSSEQEGTARAFLGLENDQAPAGDLSHAEAICIIVQDDLIAQVVDELNNSEQLATDTLLVHCSGLHPASVMQVSGVENPVASLHPLQSIASAAQGVELLPGSYFTVEGDNPGVRLATELAESIGGKVRTLSAEDKALYHAAAVVASNCLIALCDSAIEIFTECGFTEDDSRLMLLPLIEGTVNNLKNMPAHKALTGPVSRGDMTTVKEHLQQLSARMPEQEIIYRLLGKRCVELASEDHRLSGEQGEILRKILQ